mgnify:FL=1
MRLVFTNSAWEDYPWFQDHDRRLLKRITQLTKNCMRSAFDGIGKPEPLKADLAGYWSRRINDEHRLVYTATERELIIIACRYHYSK